MIVNFNSTHNSNSASFIVISEYDLWVEKDDNRKAGARVYIRFSNYLDPSMDSIVFFYNTPSANSAYNNIISSLNSNQSEITISCYCC